VTMKTNSMWLEYEMAKWKEEKYPNMQLNEYQKKLAIAEQQKINELKDSENKKFRQAVLNNYIKNPPNFCF